MKKSKVEAVAEESEFYRIDEETGELCIGDQCFMVKINEETGDFAVEMDPNVEECNIVSRRLAKAVLKSMIQDEAPVVRFRKKARKATA
jgi:hypothetical protein